MDGREVCGTLNAIAYGIESVKDLSREPASQCALAILTPDGYFSHIPARRLIEAVDVALSEGVLPSPEMYSRRFTDEEIVEFLRLLQTELRDRLSGKGTGVGSRLGTKCRDLDEYDR